MTYCKPEPTTVSPVAITVSEKTQVANETGFSLPDPTELKLKQSKQPGNENGHRTINDADEPDCQEIKALLEPVADSILADEFAFGDIECEHKLKAIQKKYPEFTLESLRISLKNLLGNDDDQAIKDPKLADTLVSLVIDKGCELFHDSSGTAYVTIPVDAHRETWKLHSLGFRRWLRQLWYKTTNTGLSPQVVSDASDTLDAKASCEGNEDEVYIRVAHANNAIYIDLCDDAWQAVEIRSTGWSVIDNPPVKFIRTPGMLPLPLPKGGGQASEKIGKLRELINAPTDEIWKLVIAWLLGAYSEGPYPILTTLGEQGSAKSFTCRLLRRLVDPSEVEVTTSPKDSRDVIIAATHSYVVALDNLSGIPEWLSDLLCGISTGTASRERKLFSNDEEALFKAKRPIILNGIDLVMKTDTADRALLISLPTISEEKRRDEKEVLSRFAAVASEIMGGIYDIISLNFRESTNHNAR